jgi:hypothetical protein
VVKISLGWVAGVPWFLSMPSVDLGADIGVG